MENMNCELFSILRESIIEFYPKEEYSIDVFLLNTLLVLLKGRLCYKIDIHNILLRKYLIDIIKTLYINFLTINDDMEPLMFLTENKGKINQDIGILLGYCYTGKNWDNENIDRYMIMPTVKYNDKQIFLYTTMVPEYEFSNTKDKILIIQKKYQELLLIYGFIVSITIYDYPAYDEPNFEYDISHVLLQ